MHPYRDLPDESFWRRCAQSDEFARDSLYRPKVQLSPGTRIATAGSCFAQHVGRYLRDSTATLIDVEPAPVELRPETARRFGYGLFSARYGNIYTVRQLLQLAQDVFEPTGEPPIVWEKGGRFFDAARPAVEPEGLASAEEVIQAREFHLSRLKVLFREMDLFVFTMGMTETWEHTASNRVVPIAPGVIAGEDQVDDFQLKNMNFYEVVEDFQKFMELLKSHRQKDLHYILTVSPVPITATASQKHVLPSSIYTKCTLRSASGYLFDTHPEIDYFPGFELVTNPAARGVFFGPNLRNVSPEGVDMTMRVFLSQHGRQGVDIDTGDLGFVEDPQCEEILLEAFET